MKKIATGLFALAIACSAHAQKYFTKNAKISFTSKTPIETIHADNGQVLAIIDPASKQVAFSLLIRGFLFEKQLMQDHFNEEVLESDKYPKASFTGQITDDINLAKPGKHTVHLTGMLAMHGVTKPLATQADIEMVSGSLKASCNFKVNFKDYNIKMPSVLQNNISPSILVSVKANAQPMNK